jgi:hypothetical protein
VEADPCHPHRQGRIFTAGMIKGLVESASPHECIAVDRTVGGD